MIWIAPSEKDTDNAALEKRLWDAADQFRANSGLKSQARFADIVAQQQAVIFQIQNLRRTRDLLLPRLLSGQVNFLNRHLGDEDFKQPLDAFEKIAKEGRKFWLNLVLATQQPRDIPPGILSQMGTLVVHRLINEADRKVVEMACGQLDAAAAKFLPSLGPGEAAIIGVDFPIPLTIQIEQPTKNLRPTSAGPQFTKWLQPNAASTPKSAAPAAQVAAASPKPAKAPMPAKPIAPPANDDDDIPF
jgi:hypothetical protein